MLLAKLLYSPSEVAELLGVSRTYLYELLFREIDPIPSFVLGRNRKIPANRLQEWIDRQS